MATRSSVIGSEARGEAPRGGDRGGRLAEGRAVAQQLGAEQVGGEVAVAEAEPGVGAVAGERVDGGEGLAGEAPAGLGVLGAGQGVGDGVEVGADVEAVEPVVVAGVDDDGDVGRVDDLDEPAEEARRPHTARQRRDHAVSVPAGIRDPRRAGRPAGGGSRCPRRKGATVRCRP